MVDKIISRNVDIHSQVGEWFNPAVSKTAVALRYRVFESHPASLNYYKISGGSSPSTSAIKEILILAMGIEALLVVSYCVIGFALSFYWFKRDYEEEYERADENDEPIERGMAGLLLLAFIIFWPFVLIKNLTKHKTL